MSGSRPTGFGRIHAPDETYLAALPPEIWRLSAGILS